MSARKVGKRSSIRLATPEDLEAILALINTTNRLF